MKRQFSIVLAISLAAVIQLGAADLYVSNGGSAEECTLAESCDFQTALNIARTNNQADTIHVASGTYNISSTLTYVPDSGEDENSLTIQGVGADSTILDGGRSVSWGGGTKIIDIYTEGLSDDSDADITIRGVTFLNGMYDSSYESGALFVHTVSADITIEDSIFSDNYATFYGGGAYIYSTDGNATLTSNTFSGNFSGHGGGGAFIVSSAATLTNNTFNSNSGGLGHSGGVFVASSVAILTNNTFNDNSCEDGGGGTDIHSSVATLTNNIFIGNSVWGGFETGSGGGASIGASVVTLINNIFSNSYSNAGGGGTYIYSTDGNATLTNNIFIGNSIGYGSGGGVSIRLGTDSAKAELYNNIIWNNTVSHYYYEPRGDDLYVNSDGDRNGIGSTVKLYNNNLGFDANFTSGQSEDLYISNTDNYFQADNLKEDPEFVDAANGDFHLLESSPLIDEGNISAPALPATDFEGNDRLIDGNGDGIAMPDIGADEFVLIPVTIADILEYFDESVAKGELVGDGPGNSADKRLNAFHNMLLEAESMIATGDPDICKQLTSIDIHCDGPSKPKDFVGGVAVPELNSMILELKASRGCS